MKTEQKGLPDEIVQFIGECRKKPNSQSYLIAVLQKVQTHFGYLSRESMDEVSQRMQVPSANVTGVATFYHFFSFVPRGEHRVTICLGTACFVRGADKVLERAEDLLGIKAGQTTPDGKFSIECARCLGACALAPIMVVGERVYGNVKPSEVQKILTEYGYKKTK